MERSGHQNEEGRVKWRNWGCAGRNGHQKNNRTTKGRGRGDGVVKEQKHRNEEGRGRGSRDALGGSGDAWEGAVTNALLMQWCAGHQIFTCRPLSAPSYAVLYALI